MKGLTILGDKAPKDCVIGEGVDIEEGAKINVTERLVIGDRTVINAGAVIEGRDVELGCECWLAEHAHIGGGSCFGKWSSFKCGDWLHMGRYSHVNTARSVVMGDEVGLGRGTCVYTHGAYLSAWEGFPVDWDGVVIGSRVWMPKATVMPGVRLGDDTVVAAESLVTASFPGGCLIGGIPAKRLRDDMYPRELTAREKKNFVAMIETDLGVELELVAGEQIVCGSTLFDLTIRVIDGPADKAAKRLKNQLRRYGIRFRYKAVGGRYIKW